MFIKFQVWFFILASVLFAVGLPSNYSSASNQVSTPTIISTPIPQSINTSAQAHSISYHYDAAGRLVSADYGDTYIIYVYDKAGNLLRQAVLNVRTIYLPLVLKRM